jgi:arylamine N-acetyltransferase
MNIIAKIGTYTLFLYTLEYNHRLPASDFLDTCLFCSATGDRRTDLTDRRKKKCDVHQSVSSHVKLSRVLRENIKCTHSRQFLARDYIVDLASQVCRFGPKSR